MLTPERLAAIRARLERAPAGPYLARPLSIVHGYHLAARDRVLGTLRDDDGVKEFFVYAACDMRALLEEVDRLTRALDLATTDDGEQGEFADEMNEVHR